MFSCSKNVSARSTGQECIIFGSGGGFAGVTTSYELYKNGDVFKADQKTTNAIYLGKIEKNKAVQMFGTYKHLQIDSLLLHEPGNRYYFIEKNDSKGNVHKIVWGMNKLENRSISIYHDLLMNLIKSFNTVKKN